MLCWQPLNKLYKTLSKYIKKLRISLSFLVSIKIKTDGGKTKKIDLSQQGKLIEFALAFLR